MNFERQNKIREYIDEKEIVTLQELKELCPDVSIMTLRRDLLALEEQHAVVKIRGGARTVRHSGDPGFSDRLHENVEAKTTLAKKALELIHPGNAIFLDASTTNLVLARLLPDIPLNIFTNGPNIGLELCRLNNPIITLCSGTINRTSLALSGQSTLAMLDSINIDIAFVGVSGCSAAAGFTCGTEMEMLVKRHVIQKARTSIIMCDWCKFSRLMPYTFAVFEDIDYLISDRPLPPDISREAKRAHITVL